MQDCRLHRRGEQQFWVVEEVLIQRILPGHEDDEGVTSGPAGATGLLPQGRQSSGISGDDDGVHPRDVHPQLQGVRRHHGSHGSVLQPGFDGSTILGQVSGAIGGDPRPTGHPVLGVGRDDLCQ